MAAEKVVKDKRARKANFGSQEVKILLEELQVESAILFSSHSATITNDVKKGVWERIVSKINSCGVAVRTVAEVKEKWRALKGAVLNRKRDEAKTGGGPAPAPVPFEDIILSIIGDKSNLFNGVTGEDDNSTAGFDSFGPAPSSVSVPDTIHSDAVPGCSRWDDNGDDRASSPTDKPPNQVSYIQVEGVDGPMFVPFAMESQQTPPADSVPVTPVTTKHKKNKTQCKRKMSDKPVLLNTDNNSALVDEWLKCQVEESKVRKRYYELKTLKIQVELEKLEKGHDN